MGQATLAASPSQNLHLSFHEEQASESCDLHASISMDQDKQTSSTESATALTNKDSKRTAAAVAPVAPASSSMQRTMLQAAYQASGRGS